MGWIFQKCEHGERVSQCYHNPRCGNQVPGNRATTFGRWAIAIGGPVLEFTGTAGTPPDTDSIATAGDYARYAAAAMNAATADDTEFIADGATVTAYVHGLAHVSATFELDEGRPYPGEAGTP